MQKDPEMTWDGAYPYDVLAPVGITPQSSMQDILKANRYFVRRGDLSKEVADAGRRLRRIESRLFYDFFLYQMEQMAIKERPDHEEAGS